MPLIDDLYRRAKHSCELCHASHELAAHTIRPESDELAHRVLLCGTCRPQLLGDEPLDDKHWYCLQDSIWSITPVVQVVSWRLLHTLAKTEPWARDLLDQAYLEEEVLDWARETLPEQQSGDAVITLDANGTVLEEGDSITLVRNLDVKGAGFTAKQGTLVKQIRLTGDPEYIEGKINNITIMLKTKFIKRA